MGDSRSSGHVDVEVGDTRFEIAASNLIIRGLPSPTTLEPPRLVRYETTAQNMGGNQNPCDPMIRLVPGVSFVTIENLRVDGGALSGAGACLGASANEPGGNPQPNVNDVEISTNFFPGAGNTLRDITIDGVSFLNAVGRALIIWGPDIERVQVRNSSFQEANLTGILIGRDGVWPANQELHLSCDPSNLASVANVPRDISIEGNTFWRSWTGATSQNNARDTVYRNNEFIDNYYQPYDQGGGTVNDEVCSYNTQFLGRNFFDGRGVDKDTSALELHGLNTRVQAEGGNRTEIRNYFGMGIIARSVAGLVIRDAVIQDNARVNQVTEFGNLRWGGIEFYNVCVQEGGSAPVCRRLIDGVDIQNNTTSNTFFGPGGTQIFGIRFTPGQGGVQNDDARNVTIPSNNILSPNVSGPICHPPKNAYFAVNSNIGFSDGPPCP